MKNLNEFETVRLNVDDVVQQRNEALMLVAYHAGGATSAALSEREPLEIGRAPPCGLVIPDESVSRRHARLRLVAGQVFLEDLGSMNGTRVGDRAVDGETPVAVTDRVTLGNVELRFSNPRGAARAARHVEGYDLFRQHLDDEVVRSRHFGRRTALLVVRATGHEDAGALVPRVTALLSPVDRAALFSRDTIFVLLPEIDDQRLAQVISGLVKKGELPPLVVGSAVMPTDAATPDELIDVAQEALGKTTASAPSQRASSGPRQLVRDASSKTRVVKSEKMVALFKEIEKLQKAPYPVLIHGETGAGKEVIARAIHEGRGDKPMISINCAALPATLLESTLFGIEGKIATDVKERAGVFEAAEGGTVFLDEIGELSPAAQAALLRVLEEKKVSRLGSTKTINVDARVIAASHRDLEEMVEKGQFRQDLLFRLNAITLNLPPLRERTDEIVPLAERFIAETAKELGRAPPSLSSAARELMLAYPWPGNVRELKNAMNRAVAISDGDVICPEDLHEKVRRFAAPPARQPTGMIRLDGIGSVPTIDNNGDLTLKELVDQYEKRVIEEALSSTGGNQTLAAQKLKTPLRTLVHKIKQLGVNKNGAVA